MRKAFLYFFVVLVSVSCSNKKEPNAANFEQALKESFKGAKICSNVQPMDTGDVQSFFDDLLGISGFPQGDAQANSGWGEIKRNVDTGKAKIIEYYVTDLLGANQKHKAEQKIVFDALRKGGLLHPESLIPSRTRGLFSVNRTVAILNEQALKYYSEHTTNDGLQSHKSAQLCYGDLRVTKVVKWTEPVIYMGHKIATVEFMLEATNVADWAKPIVHELDLSTPETRDMVLTSEGWSADLSILK